MKELQDEVLFTYHNNIEIQSFNDRHAHNILEKRQNDQSLNKQPSAVQGLTGSPLTQTVCQF